ncbi:MAG: hypothetical protein WAN75_36275 [Xanthobacteraceae bacterium]
MPLREGSFRQTGRNLDIRLGRAADTGTLKLDNSATFAGTVAGMTGHDTIDFADIDPTKVQTPSFGDDQKRDAHRH